jgi:hypothetical protein
MCKLLQGYHCNMNIKNKHQTTSSASNQSLTESHIAASEMRENNP